MEQHNNKIIVHPNTNAFLESEINRLFNLLEPGTKQIIHTQITLNPSLTGKEVLEILEKGKEKDIINAGEQYEYSLRQSSTFKVVWYVGGRVKETLVRNVSEKLAYALRANSRLKYKIGMLMVEPC